MSSHDLKCAVVSQYPFPIGMAPTNRILAYARGLMENNVDVEVFVHSPTRREDASVSSKDSGVYKGVRYQHTVGQTSHRFQVVRAISIVSGFRRFWGYVCTYRALSQSNRQGSIDCVIVSMDDVLSLLVYSAIARCLGAKSVFIYDEYPVPIRHKLKNEIPRWKALGYSIVLRGFSGYVSISEDLKRFYNSLCRKETFVLPVITDVSRFRDASPTTLCVSRGGYVCYMGNLELAKDNVDNIIRAFAIIAPRFPKIRLFLYGAASGHVRELLEELIAGFGLHDRVEFKGVIPSERVPSVLRNALLLVSSQPDTVRASGGFPTKLGEYLASGVPAILTNVGENARYVRDNVHLFFTKPNDADEYAEKMAYVLDNYEDAQRVARNGREYLFSHFSHKSMGKELKEFIVGL